jgi:hypothetical protein
MTYNKKKMLVFIETKVFTQLVMEYLEDDEYRELQQHVMKDPEIGKIIRSSGGVRKLRWSRKGMGKSGGIRTIYYWAKARDQIYMLTIYIPITPQEAIFNTPSCSELAAFFNPKSSKYLKYSCAFCQSKRFNFLQAER